MKVRKVENDTATIHFTLEELQKLCEKFREDEENQELYSVFLIAKELCSNNAEELKPQLKEQIRKLQPRISRLVTVANQLDGFGVLPSEFMQDNKNHELGFMKNTNGNISYIGYYVGIFCGIFNFFTNGKDIFTQNERTGERLSPAWGSMEMFLRNFTAFEKRFLQWQRNLDGFLEFRGKIMPYDAHWADDNTFQFYFAESFLEDSDSDGYGVLFEYHPDEEQWIVEIQWDFDHCSYQDLLHPDEFLTKEEYRKILDRAEWEKDQVSCRIASKLGDGFLYYAKHTDHVGQAGLIEYLKEQGRKLSEVTEDEVNLSEIRTEILGKMN